MEAVLDARPEDIRCGVGGIRHGSTLRRAADIAAGLALTRLDMAHAPNAASVAGARSSRFSPARRHRGRGERLDAVRRRQFRRNAGMQDELLARVPDRHRFARAQPVGRLRRRDVDVQHAAVQPHPERETGHPLRQLRPEGQAVVPLPHAA
ncbi:unnamed protein product, partial [Penicillium discolor]